MTDEIKTCDCKEKAINKLKEFSFIAGAVFVGTTLAILLSANILKPKCPCPKGMMGPYPRMERPLPPPHPMMHPGDYHRGEFRGYYDGPRFEDRREFRGKHWAKRHHDRQLKDGKPVPQPYKKAPTPNKPEK